MGTVQNFQASAESERAILERARRGDALAAEQLFVTYLKDSPAIAGLLRRALANPEDRKEVLHEIYMQLVCSNHPFRGESRLSTYVYQVARLTIFQRYRKENARKRRFITDGAIPVEHVADNVQPDPEARCLIRENRRLILRKIEGLPQAYRDVLRLRVVHDLSYEQIAGRMHLPVNTVSTKIHKGKKLLQLAWAG